MMNNSSYTHDSAGPNNLSWGPRPGRSVAPHKFVQTWNCIPSVDDVDIFPWWKAAWIQIRYMYQRASDLADCPQIACDIGLPFWLSSVIGQVT